MTSVIQDGVVMAADGLGIFGGSDIPNRPNAAEPKIEICNGKFLCGTAGFNPLRAGQIKYDFHDWIQSIPIDRHRSVSEYAETLETNARLTFDNVASLPDEFWQSQKRMGGAFIEFNIAGYDSGRPTTCRIDIQANQRKLIFNPPDCRTVQPPVGAVYDQPMGQCVNARLGVRPLNTPQAYEFRHLLLRWSATGTIESNAPPTIRDLATRDAAMIAVEGEFNPKNVGGLPTIGVLAKFADPVIERVKGPFILFEPIYLKFFRQLRLAQPLSQQ